VFDSMPLTPGQSLSFYEILGPLGVGGMGEVYLARDTRLEREVAIKVLPAELAADEERLRRFDREAKTLASLNHPNVAGIHGIDQEGDTSFLAMELVPGEDLEARLKRGTLPLDEALDVCRQIAEGLEAAHEAGVVHRDLKPANVRITPEGAVKILDFGLAKPIGPKARKSGTSSAQSDSFLVTSEGMILGTPTYMSPEQARGKPVDRRTDIWAFGCVPFECLTGKRAFKGDAFGDLIAAILEHEVDLRALPTSTPQRVRELLARCFEKDARQRLREIGEARIALERVGSEPAVRAASRPMRGPLGWAIAALVGGLCVFGAVRTGPVEEPQPVAVRGLTTSGSDRMPSASPDGRLIAFCSERGGRQRIWLKQIETGGEQVLSDGPDFAPRFAPDGNSVLFLRVDGGRKHVYRQALLGSDARKIVDDVIDACWAPDLWSSDRSGAFEIWSAKSDGSGARQRSDDGFDAENPTAAQGGDWIVYASANPEKIGIWRVREDGTSPEQVAAGDYVQAEVSNDGRWAACLTLEAHNLRNVLHVIEIETGRLVPFEIEVKADRDRAIVPGRLRWVSDCALSKEPAIAYLGVDDQGRTGVFLQDFHPERDTGATRRPLAGFHDELTTESFDIAPDGTRITLSLVEITRKLMLAEGVKGILK
jgi:hypothetical protein